MLKLTDAYTTITIYTNELEPSAEGQSKALCDWLLNGRGI